MQTDEEIPVFSDSEDEGQKKRKIRRKRVKSGAPGWSHRLKRKARSIFNDVRLYSQCGVPVSAVLARVTDTLQKITRSQGEHHVLGELGATLACPLDVFLLPSELMEHQLPDIFAYLSDKELSTKRTVTGVTLYKHNTETDRITVTHEAGPARIYEDKSWQIGNNSTLAGYCAHTLVHISTDLARIAATYPKGMGYTLVAILTVGRKSGDSGRVGRQVPIVLAPSGRKVVLSSAIVFLQLASHQVGDSSAGVICVPVFYPGHIVCIIELFRTDNLDPYSQEEVMLGVTLGKWIGEAVNALEERSGLLGHRVNHQAMVDLVRALVTNTVPPDHVIARILASAAGGSAVPSGVDGIVTKGCSDASLPMLEASSGGVRILHSCAAKNMLKASSATLYRMVDPDRALASVYEETGAAGVPYVRTRTLLNTSRVCILSFFMVDTALNEFFPQKGDKLHIPVVIDPKARKVENGVLACRKTTKQETTEIVVNGRKEVARESPDDAAEGVETLMVYPLTTRRNKSVQGILKLANKTDGSEFGAGDVEMVSCIANYLTLAVDCISATQRAENSETTVLMKQRILGVNLKPCRHELDVTREAWQRQRHGRLVPRHLFTFAWFPVGTDNPELVLLALHLFERVLGPAFCDENDLPLFVATVCRSYRPNPYHNFEHAFNVTHCMANIILRNRNYFNALEMMSLMLATLCHDSDHPGRTNAFFWFRSDKLTQLYKSSPLENHHSYMAACMIQECGILKQLSSSNYNLGTGIFTPSSNTLSRKPLLHCLLRLLTFGKTFPAQEFFLFGEKVKQYPTQGLGMIRYLLKGIMMTACDLSGQFKHFAYASKLASNLLEEFYSQGDEERALGLTPMSSMDRTKREMVPADQINFLSLVCLPCVDILSTFFNNTRVLHQIGCNLRTRWQEVKRLQDSTGKCWATGTLKLSPPGSPLSSD
ncbi:hypothetical protein AAG570_004893 [Ranatra chinensis]|uniref:PDEase domain-containing protein n=1 Tax=Ranatra chinensis TaxID=642074 RepID=A0ABD0YH68_9HEMI